MQFGKSAEGRACGKSRRWPAFALGAILAIAATWLATAGGVWSLCFHPDELTIARWIDDVNRNGYITERGYPSGWFELFRVQFWFEEQHADWLENWNKHHAQDGRVNAVAAGTFNLQSPEPKEEKLRHTIQDGRDFNAWLYVLTAVLLFAACLESGMRPWAAFASGTFFLGTAAPLEFSHYCETDAGLLFSMAFFAWLAARALRKRSAWLALAGTFAAGFAVACKPTLTPLLLWCGAGPVAVLWEKRTAWSRGRWGGTLAGMVAAGLALACLGYATGTPALRLVPEWYFKEMHEVSKLTYAEIARNLGGHYTWGGATMVRLRFMLDHFAEMGWWPLAWGAFAWSFWFVRGRRRQLAGTPGALPLFLPFWVCCCPFVRRQELLPLAILLAMGTGWPLQWAWEALLRGPWKRRGQALLVVTAAAGALFVQGGKSLATASCFRLRDTRAEAQNWLRDSMPTETTVSMDSYVGQVDRGVGFDAREKRGLAYQWKGQPPEEDGTVSSYYIENKGFSGRLPVLNPKTGRMYPEVKASLQAFEEAVYPVRTWATSRTTPVPEFGQRPVRLVSFDKPAAGALEVSIGHARPILVQPDGTRLYGAAGPAGIGPHHAIHTVGKRSWVHLNLEDGERWLVTRWLEGGGESVKVVREGLFRPGKADLAPGGATAAKLEPSWGDRLASRMAAHAGGQCRMRGDDQTVFCASYLAQSADEAARELRLAGEPRAALELLAKEKEPGPAELVEAFLAASALGETPKPEWTAAARNAAEAAEKLAAEREKYGRAGATICGVPAGVVEDFARAKLSRAVVEPGTRLPLWLPPGRYEVSVTVRRMLPQGIAPRLFEGQTEDFSEEEMPDGSWRCSAKLETERARFLRLSGEAGDYEPYRALLEIAWSPLERTAETARAIRVALGENDGTATGTTGD